MMYRQMFTRSFLFLAVSLMISTAAFSQSSGNVESLLDTGRYVPDIATNTAGHTN